MFLLLTLNIFLTWSGVFIVNFELVIVGWKEPSSNKNLQ